MREIVLCGRYKRYLDIKMQALQHTSQLSVYAYDEAIRGLTGIALLVVQSYGEAFVYIRQRRLP